MTAEQESAAMREGGCDRAGGVIVTRVGGVALGNPERVNGMTYEETLAALAFELQTISGMLTRIAERLERAKVQP